MERSDFDSYTAELLATCAQHPRVIGLVLMGSTAAPHRIDEWSDHDFAVIVEPGAAEELRGDLSWLPRLSALVSCGRELHDGFCGIYDDGHVIEFGVTDLAGLATWHANAYDVVLDRGGVTDAMCLVAAREKPTSLFDARREFAILLATLLVGAGRARRGETLSASGALRGRAVEVLLGLLAQLGTADRTMLDDLDVRRRFERAYPEIGAELERAQQKQPAVLALKLLEITERELGSTSSYPSVAAATVRRALNRAADR